MRAPQFLRPFALGLGCVVAMSIAGAAHGSSMTFSADADTYLRDATPRGGLEFMDVRGGDIDFRGYLRFDLSGVNPALISGASLTLVKVPGASRNDNVVNARFALYGLNNEAGNTPQDWDEATFVPDDKGTEDVTTLMGVTDLDEDVAGITESIVGGGGDGSVITVSGAPLVSFLQSRIGDGGLATFILSNDDATDRGYGLGSKENATSTNHPVLTIELIPEPAAVLLALVGMGAAGLVVRRRRCV